MGVVSSVGEGWLAIKTVLVWFLWWNGLLSCDCVVVVCVCLFRQLLGRVDVCSRLTLQLESEVAETLKEHAELEQQCQELDKVINAYCRK